ncbi:tRNA adenosine(34) deaminase TadA [Stieleria sp.]|uniref:tRNA-specific adenosine deaminase n=1 Tax=Stieleria magnilauensis TaxID=2527963 RepID=A0ABX5XIN7_9BACT|nr:tRNA-specific adenosine deaminase [Planctomycetes bacterium TBK1r]
MQQQQIDEHFMGRALELAYQAVEMDEVPVGAIVIRDHQIIAAASNQRQMLKDPTAHAEMIAITQAAAAIGDWRLENTTLYVTLEPCPMCAGAILQARIPRVVFGASDGKAGAVTSLFRLLSDDRLNHQAEVVAGVKAEPCGQILTDFFASKRAMGKK